jgi:putative SOS response-associated peptidase YedK
MCGRYQNHLPRDAIARYFGARPTFSENAEHYNAAPTQMLPVVRWNPKTKERTLDLLRWGLIPHWATDPKVGYRMINARGETVATRPAYRDAFRSRRCLVPAVGFYEWKRTARGPKQPYYIIPRDQPMFGFAGLWEGWHDPRTREWLHTFTIITGPPNSLVAKLHDRMPAILDEANWPAWLGEVETSPDDLKKMIAEAYPSQMMTAYPISTRVNNVKNDDEKVIEPLG